MLTKIGVKKDSAYQVIGFLFYFLKITDDELNAGKPTDRANSFVPNPSTGISGMNKPLSTAFIAC